MNSSLPRSFKFLAANALVAGLLALVSNTQAQIIQNGGFDTNTNSIGNETNLTNGNTSMPNWTVVAAGSADVGYFQTGDFGVNSQAGNWYLDLTGTNDQTSGITDSNSKNTFGGVQQTFATISGDTYLIQFYLGNSSGYTESTAGIDAYITTSADSFSTLMGLTPNISPLLANATTATNWVPESFSFVASGPSTTLSLVGYEGGTGLQYIGLDSVSATNETTQGVPDVGSTLAFLSLGLGLLAFQKRLARRAA